MRTKDVTEILKTLGWEPYRAEDGSMFAHYHLPDRIVGISYDVVDYGEDGGKFRLSADLTTVLIALLGNMLVVKYHRISMKIRCFLRKRISMLQLQISQKAMLRNL